MRPGLRLAVVGHVVDHGKSTLVGRLLHETDALPEGKVAAIRAMSDRRGMSFEWAFVVDAMQVERDQGITIDTAQVRFHTAARGYVLIDAPGHREFLKNAITGAARADAVLLVVDARDGPQEQTRRHAYLLRLLGVRPIAVAINKMDLVDHAEPRFQMVRRDVADYLSSIGLDPGGVHFVPVVGRDGDNLRQRSPRMAWYAGPTLLEALDALPAPLPPADRPLRLPVQDVYRFDARRIVVGRIESGRVRVGDTLLFSPSNKTATVASIEGWPTAPPAEAGVGQSVGITLEEPIFVERGQIASHLAGAPTITNAFRAQLFWLGHEPLRPGASYRLRHGTAETVGVVERVEGVIDIAALSARPADRVERNAVAEVVIRTKGVLAVDDHADSPITGRFVLVDGYQIAGGGIIDVRGYPDQRPQTAPRSEHLVTVHHRVATEARARLNGHRGGILWFTGLSGAGKSTLAVELERILFAKGYQVFLLDADNVRQGLCADLGFSPADRAENIRRVGEMAALFAEAGLVVVTAFISPYRADRDRIRAVHGAFFHEVHIAAPLEVCEARDTKGLYRRARAGEIKEFTGVSAPYEPPVAPELVVDTAARSVEACIGDLLAYVESQFAWRER
jgi:bifunctional enzyme CysN/CysC